MRLTRGSLGDRLALRVLGFAVAWLLRAVGATWRLRLSGEDPFAPGTPFVGAVWHRGLLVAAHTWRNRGLGVSVSRSRDGDRIDAVLRHLGFAASPRGSSSRGGSALLREAIRRIRAGEVIALLPDGPRGPAGVAKAGAVVLAGACGAPLVPVGIAARPCLRFASWDGAFLPLPFARVRCHYGTPLHVPKRASAEEVEALRGELEATLHRLDAELERSLERPTPVPVAGSSDRS